MRRLWWLNRWIHGTAIGVNQDVFGHLDRTAIGRDFRVPPADEVCCGIKWCGNATYQPFPGSDNSASGITNNGTGTGADGATDDRTGLVRAGGVAGAGAANAQQGKQPRD